MAFKINITKAGYNVLTETNPDNLIFSSDYNTFKYAAAGTVTFTIAAGGASATEYTLTHSFGYIPVAQAYYTDNTLSKYYPLTYYAPSGSGGYLYIVFYITSTQLIFRVVVFGSTPAKNVTIPYKIFKNNTGL